jgi:hypothetical protein
VSSEFTAPARAVGPRVYRPARATALRHDRRVDLEVLARVRVDHAVHEAAVFGRRELERGRRKARLGIGRIVASEIEAPNIVVNLV